jgi:hypothetical protein
LDTLWADARGSNIARAFARRLNSRSTYWTVGQWEHYGVTAVVICQGIGLPWKYYSSQRTKDRVKGLSEYCIHIHNPCKDRALRHWYNMTNNRPEGNYHTGDVLEPTVGMVAPGGQQGDEK